MGTDGAWPSACDICVVGGGLAGLATAWRLAQSGQRTVLLERRVPAGAASSANAGTLAIQNKRPPLLPFFRDALAEWARVAEELGVEIGYGKPGGLHIARSNEDAQRLRKNFENHGALGLAGEWLDAAALRAEAPWLGDGIIAALQVLAVLVQEGRSAAEVCRVFEPLPQVLKNVRFTGPSPLRDERVQRDIRSAEQRLAGSGRVLIRESGTEPLVRVMAEGEDSVLVTRVVDDLCGIIAAARVPENAK